MIKYWTRAQHSVPPPKYHQLFFDNYYWAIAKLNHKNDREQAAANIRILTGEIRLYPINGELQIELVGGISTLVGFAEANMTKKGPDHPCNAVYWYNLLIFENKNLKIARSFALFSQVIGPTLHQRFR